MNPAESIVNIGERRLQTRLLLLPPLVALGLFGRFSALGLFVVNAVALLSYMYALQPPAIMFHIIWGILILVAALWGPGTWSVDHWMQRRRGAA